jgi:hypothetical protein
MQACRVVRRGRYAVDRSDVMRERLEKILRAEADEYARQYDWGPVVRRGDLWAEREERPDSYKGACVWGVEVARDDDGEAIVWPPTRAGLRAAIAWCDMKNRRGGSDD